MKQSYEIEGIHCEGCVALIKEVLSELPGVDKVDLDLAGKLDLEVNNGLDKRNMALEINEALEEHGYSVTA